MGSFIGHMTERTPWESWTGNVLVDSAGLGSEEICERGRRRALSTHQCP